MNISKINLKKFIEINPKEEFFIDCPGQYFIYLLVNDEDIVYVGQTFKVNHRLVDHISSNKIFNKIFIRKVNKKRALFFESYLIFFLRPKYNRMISSNLRFLPFDGLYRNNVHGRSFNVVFIGDIPYVDSKGIVFIRSYYSHKSSCSSIEDQHRWEKQKIIDDEKRKKRDERLKNVPLNDLCWTNEDNYLKILKDEN